jgi:hypothetical protein
MQRTSFAENNGHELPGFGAEMAGDAEDTTAFPAIQTISRAGIHSIRDSMTLAQRL